MTNISPESYGEFKGSTSAKLDMLFKLMNTTNENVTSLQNDVQDLKDTKTWSLGWLSGVGIFAGLLGAILKEKFLKSL